MAWFRAVVATTVMTMVCGLLAGGAARAEALQFGFLGSSSDQLAEELPHPQALVQDIARPDRNLSGGLTGATRTVQVTQPVRPSIVIKPIPGSETVSDSDPPEPLPPSPEEAAAERAVEVAYWNTARESHNPVMLRAYLNRYPDGAFSELASLLLEQLEREEATGPDREPVNVFDERQIDLAFWSAIQDSTAPADFEAYLDAHPDGAFVQLARNRLAALTGGTEPEEIHTVPDEPATTVDPQELARSLQSELRRVGCDPGTPDGIWGPRSRRALEQFNRHAGTSFGTGTATAEALEAVRSRSTVCPAVAQQPKRPAAQRPAAQRPAAQRPAAQRPAAQRPAAQPPTAPAAQPSAAPLPSCTWALRRGQPTWYCSLN
jgi:hypothetical protein